MSFFSRIKNILQKRNVDTTNVVGIPYLDTNSSFNISEHLNLIIDTIVNYIVEDNIALTDGKSREIPDFLVNNLNTTNRLALREAIYAMFKYGTGILAFDKRFNFTHIRNDESSVDILQNVDTRQLTYRVRHFNKVYNSKNSILLYIGNDIKNRKSLSEKFPNTLSLGGKIYTLFTNYLDDGDGMKLHARVRGVTDQEKLVNYANVFNKMMTGGQKVIVTNDLVDASLISKHYRNYDIREAKELLPEINKFFRVPASILEGKSTLEELDIFKQTTIKHYQQLICLFLNNALSENALKLGRALVFKQTIYNTERLKSEAGNLVQAGIITQDEARIKLGYEALSTDESSNLHLNVNLHIKEEPQNQTSLI